MRKRVPRHHRRADRGNAFYADMRAYTDVGGSRHEALIPEGQKKPTMDESVAIQLLARRIRYYEDRRVGKIAPPAPPVRVPTLADYLPRHLELKRGTVRPYTLSREEQRLRQVFDGFPQAHRGTAHRGHRAVGERFTSLARSPARPLARHALLCGERQPHAQRAVELLRERVG